MASKMASPHLYMRIFAGLCQILYYNTCLLMFYKSTNPFREVSEQSESI